MLARDFKIGACKIFRAVVDYAGNRDVAQFGRALPWGGRGREFKSRRSDQ